VIKKAVLLIPVREWAEGARGWLEVTTEEAWNASFYVT
jgi:hypothetical protein